MTPLDTCEAACPARARPIPGPRGRFRDRRRGLGRLRAREPLDRLRAISGRFARSRAARPAFLDPRPARLRAPVQGRAGQLALRDGAGAGAERPRDLPAARQGARRLVLDQRLALCPRPAGGFRPLAPARQRRLGLRRRAAVFPALRASGARREHAPRRRRSALRVRRDRAARAVRRLHRRSRAGRHPRQRRFQRPGAGRRRLLPDHVAAGHPLEHGARLSAPGVASDKP